MNLNPYNWIAAIFLGIALGLLVWMIFFDHSYEECLKVYSTDTCIMELR